MFAMLAIYFQTQLFFVFLVYCTNLIQNVKILCAILSTLDLYGPTFTLLPYEDNRKAPYGRHISPISIDHVQTCTIDECQLKRPITAGPADSLGAFGAIMIGHVQFQDASSFYSQEIQAPIKAI